MGKYIRLLVATLLVALNACDNDDTDSYSKQELTIVKYGTSFGLCLGYCINSITLNNNTIVFTKSGWQLEEQLPDITLSTAIDSKYLSAISNHITFDTFTKLDQTIGCPDCADGGAEWIEIQKGDSIYKVTFEYFNEPDELQPIIAYLRSYLHAFKNQESEKMINFNQRVLIDHKATIFEMTKADGSNTHLINIVNNGDTTDYYDKNLEEIHKQNKLHIKITGTIENDSTTFEYNFPQPNVKIRNIASFAVSPIN